MRTETNHKYICCRIFPPTPNTAYCIHDNVSVCPTDEVRADVSEAQQECEERTVEKPEQAESGLEEGASDSNPPLERENSTESAPSDTAPEERAPAAPQ